MKLYEIANELREIESLIDSGELLFEELFDTIESLDIMFDDKIENCCFLIKESEARSSGINGEIKRLQELKRLEDSKESVLFSGEVYEKYQELCVHWKMQARSARWFREYLNELDMMGLITTKISGKGVRGNTRLITLAFPKEKVKTALKSKFE